VQQLHPVLSSYTVLAAAATAAAAAAASAVAAASAYMSLLAECQSGLAGLAWMGLCCWHVCWVHVALQEEHTLASRGIRRHFFLQQQQVCSSAPKCTSSHCAVQYLSLIRALCDQVRLSTTCVVLFFRDRGTFKHLPLLTSGQLGSCRLQHALGVPCRVVICGMCQH